MSVPWRLTASTSSDRGVLASSSIIVAGRIASKFSIVAFLVVAARLLTREEYGIYSYVLVLAYTFAILADAQVSVIAGRDVAAGRRSPAVAYRSAMPVALAGGAVSAAAMLLFGLIDDGPGTSESMLLVAGAYVIFNRLLGLGLDMLRALGRFKVEASIETGGTVLLVAGATVAAAVGLGVTAVLVVFALHSLLAAAVCRLLLRDEVRAPAPAPGYRRSLVRSGIRLGFAAGATAVATRTPLVVLGLAGSATAVAGYSAAMRFADTMYLLALTAGQALLPSIASIMATDPHRARRLTRRAIAWTTIAGALLAGALAPFGSEVTTFAFGDSYRSAGPLMSAMMAGVPFVGMFWISWFALCAHGRERDVARLSVTCAGVSLLAAVLVIPGGGALGAAWVYAGALVLLALGTYAMFEHQVRDETALPA
ncbi:MAG: Polysaccharide biosynthesis protein [Solirubrobacteraceae bacterium]|nr:Polysaccharide biosynthesis protein [Solirubrobacteraceae bacterium]